VAKFAPGDRVHVPSLGTGVVREARNGGRYVVEIKGRTMTIPGDRMEAAGPAPAARRRNRDVTTPPAAASPSDSGPATSIDLHGKTVEAAIDAMDRFLNDALLDGRRQVHVIHGRGGGRLKAAVHTRLAQLRSLRGFRIDPGNPGVTIVSL
jgi:DNA mismatch repair protein MutS2